MPWRRLHFVKGAVDAVADLEFLLERLEVDVARLGLDGAVKDQVHIADDRSGIRFGRGRCCVEFLLIALDRGDLAFTKLLEDIIHGGLLASVMGGDELLHLVARSHDLGNLPVEGEAEILKRLSVQRVGKGYGQDVAGSRHRDHAMEPCHSRGDEMDQGRHRLEIGEVDGVDSQFRPDDLGQLVVGDDALLDQDIVDGASRVEGLVQEFLTRDIIDGSRSFDDVDNLMGIHEI